MKKVAGTLRLNLAQYRELAAFAQFGSDLDKATQAQLTRGERLVEILKQDQFIPMPVEDQILIIWLASEGYLDDIPVNKLKECEKEFFKFIENRYPQITEKIKQEKKLTDDILTTLKKVATECKRICGMGEDK